VAGAPPQTRPRWGAYNAFPSHVADLVWALRGGEEKGKGEEAKRGKGM